MLSPSTSSRTKQKLNTSAEVEQYNLQIQESIESLCNLHSQPSTQGYDFANGKRGARLPGINNGAGGNIDDHFNWPTAIVAAIVLIPAFLALTFGAFEFYGAKHIEIAAAFAAVICLALITFVARGQIFAQALPQNFRPLMTRLIHEISSYSIAALVCLPLWVILYLIAAAFVPVHIAMAVASFLATAANLYLGGPFGEKKRRLTSNIASTKRQSSHRAVSKAVSKALSKAEAKAQARRKFRQTSGEKFKASYFAMKPEAICKYYQLFFSKSALAQLFEQSLSFAYSAHERELVIDAEAPGFDIIPRHKGAKFTKSSMSVRYLEASPQDRSGQYRQFLGSWALRMAADALFADRAGALDSVIFNAFSLIVVPETGKDERGCLLSVRVTREDLAKLDISRVDKMACLRKLGARLGTDSAAVSIYSSTPLSAVQPLRTTESTSGDTMGQDSALNLSSIDPVEFEHLIANLLVRMGLETQLTKASHDGGVDIVALDKRPILGGKIIIQAKRYKRTVPVSCVRDLYGAMQHEGASKAILVTTSKLGADAWQFAEGKPLQLIEGQQLLELLRLQGIQAHL